MEAQIRTSTADPLADDGDPPDQRRSCWIVILGWALSIACLLLFFVWVPVDDTVVAMLQGHPLLLALAMVATVGNLGLRGTRWMVLLGRHTLADFRLAASVSIIGLALNATIPGKIGEIARVGLAARLMKVRVGEAAMASLIERVVDLAVLSGLGFITITMTPPLTQPWQGVFSRAALVRLAATLLLTSASAAALILLAGHDRFGKWVRQTISARIGSQLWRQRFRRLALDLRNGARRLRSRRATLPALVSTLALWVLLGVGVYAVGLAMPGVECTFPAALAFAVVTTLASALPSAPGAWGVYEAAGVVVGSTLVQAESPSNLAAFVVASHATQYFPVVGMGFACWLRLGRLRSRDPLEDADAGGIGPDRELEP